MLDKRDDLPWATGVNNAEHTKPRDQKLSQYEEDFVKWSFRKTQEIMTLSLHERVLAFERHYPELTGPDRHAILHSLATAQPPTYAEYAEE
jgi:hypothetical protein